MYVSPAPDAVTSLSVAETSENSLPSIDARSGTVASSDFSFVSGAAGGGCPGVT